MGSADDAPDRRRDGDDQQARCDEDGDDALVEPVGQLRLEPVDASIFDMRALSLLMRPSISNMRGCSAEFGWSILPSTSGMAHDRQ